MSTGASVPDDRRYTSEHEWARALDEVVTVGITDFAQDQLGDVVYVELPAIGARITAGSEFGVIESVKSASDLFAPVSGEVIEINERLTDQPELVNESPYDEGWMIRVRASNVGELDSLMDSQAYRRHVGG